MSREERASSLRLALRDIGGGRADDVSRRLIDLERDLGADEYGRVDLRSSNSRTDTTTNTSTRDSSSNINVTISDNRAANTNTNTKNQTSLVTQKQRQQFAEQFLRLSNVGFQQAQQVQQAIMNGDKDEQVWNHFRSQNNTTAQLLAPPQQPELPAPPEQHTLPAPSQQQALPPAPQQLALPAPPPPAPSQKLPEPQQLTRLPVQTYASAPVLSRYGGDFGKTAQHHTTTTTTTTTSSSLAQQYGGQAFPQAQQPTPVHAQQQQTPQSMQPQQLAYQQPLQITNGAAQNSMVVQDWLQGQIQPHNNGQQQAQQAYPQPMPQQQATPAYSAMPQLQIADKPSRRRHTESSQQQPPMQLTQTPHQPGQSYQQPPLQNPQQIGQQPLQLMSAPQQQGLYQPTMSSPAGELVLAKEKKHKKHHKEHHKHRN